MVGNKVGMGQQPPPRVLLVEDNARIAMDLEDILAGFGCEVVGPISTPRSLIICWRTEKQAPLADTLNDKNIPFAMCTGAGEEHVSSLYPHTPILGKPYNPDDVALVVNSLIASRLAGV